MLNHQPRIALAGNPNCGKTALFNTLTGSSQKVANYAGVTVEKKTGVAQFQSGEPFTIVDLPGIYSLNARTLDEEVSKKILLGTIDHQGKPDAILAVMDTQSIERSLNFVLELRDLGIPMVVALNMTDLSRKRGFDIDTDLLSRELGCPVTETIATKGDGTKNLIKTLYSQLEKPKQDKLQSSAANPAQNKLTEKDLILERFQETDRILKLAIKKNIGPADTSKKIDRFLLHPFFGPLTLLLILAFVFQAIFNWASIPADFIDSSISALGEWISSVLPEGPVRSLLVDGIIAGVGSVLVFLPQIITLFLFILILEDTGYMARAAFILDRIMRSFGLHGRSVIPILSSYACAVPGIMATRTIENPLERLVTILVAPLTTCSARLPVYALLIGAFIPNTAVFGPIRLQGLVLFALYAGGIVATLLTALIFRKTVLKGEGQSFIMELPTYKWPSFKNLFYGILDRARIFVRRAGTVILSMSVLIWVLATYPKPPSDAVINSDNPAINYSFAGKIGHFIEPAIRPIGFDWRIGIALVPGFAAREVMVSALSTVYAIEAGDSSPSEAKAITDTNPNGTSNKEEATTEDSENKSEKLLGERLRNEWSLATALSLLVWYIFALQCLSTVAVVKRETNGWTWPITQLVLFTLLAYGASFVTYRSAIYFLEGTL